MIPQQHLLNYLHVLSKHLHRRTFFSSVHSNFTQYSASECLFSLAHFNLILDMTPSSCKTNFSYRKRQLLRFQMVICEAQYINFFLWPSYPSKFAAPQAGAWLKTGSDLQSGRLFDNRGNKSFSFISQFLRFVFICQLFCIILYILMYS